MTAQVGDPVDVYQAKGVAPVEVQPAADGTLLAVCGGCGFQWDADHCIVADGRRGYECPRCTLTAACDALEGQTERLARATEQAQQLLTARGELAHLRPQNALLKKEADTMRAALRRHAIQHAGMERTCCTECKGIWPTAEPETHAASCLAESIKS